MKFKILYLLFTAILVLLFLEVSIRLLHLAPKIGQANLNYVKDPYLPFKQKPFSVVSGRSRTNEYDYVYKHNSLGFRDVEHSIEKPDGVFRILGLGDSFTYGQGASFEETYLYRLEKMLNEREGDHPRVEIIKAGMRRYFPEVERIFLERYGLRYQPDLILVAFVPNDVIDTFLGIDAVTVDEKGRFLKDKKARDVGKIGNWLYLHSHLCRIILHKYITYRNIKNRQYRFSEIYKPNGFHEKDWRKLEDEYKKMIKIANQANIPIVFIHIPQIGPWDDSSSYPARRLSDFCSKQGVIFIDVLPAMKEAAKQDVLYWEIDGHCNGAGYRVIAETIFSTLTEKGLVP
jgi:lysophospholipase L1-like esterase